MLRAACGNRIGSRTMAVIASATMMPAMPYLAPAALESSPQHIVSHDVHFNMMRQSGMDTCAKEEEHYHSNSQDGISEKLRGERDVGPTCGFTTSSEVGSGATIGTLQNRYPRI
jgi:hypothetical protein